MNIKNNKRAFTLVEMIIVIAVIAVLAAMLVLVLPSVIDKAKHASATSDARNTATAYEKYNVARDFRLLLMHISICRILQVRQCWNTAR